MPKISEKLFPKICEIITERDNINLLNKKNDLRARWCSLTAKND